MSNNKSATKCMFELLDEREVEYEWNSESFSYDGFNGVWWIVEGRHDNNVNLYAPCATPEQAIEVTLGRGTCHDIWDIELTGRLRFQCSECKGVSLDIAPRFCPVCGRKVVDNAQ